MKNSKDIILASLKKNLSSVPKCDKPDLLDITLGGVQYSDKLQQFIDVSKAVGGNAIRLSGDINETIKSLYPQARVFASNLPEISLASVNPDTVGSAQELNGVDVAIVRGEVGVAENGCVWIPQSVKEKAVYFIAEYLVIILSSSAIVNNMHEAYAKISFNDYGFGTFISGPSKTADIEQALVMGAQSAKGVTVIIVG